MDVESTYSSVRTIPNCISLSVWLNQRKLDKRKKVLFNVEIIPNLLLTLLDTDVFLFSIILIGEIKKLLWTNPQNEFFIERLNLKYYNKTLKKLTKAHLLMEQREVRPCW